MRNLRIGIIITMLMLASMIFYVVKQPRYNIQTEGILYTVNKGSKTITVFDLFVGKEIEEIKLEIESHEATLVKNPNRIVVTNYGLSDKAAKSITVINPATNTIEKTIVLGESERPHGIMTMPKNNTVGVVTDVGNHLSVVNVTTGIVEKQISTTQDFSHLLVHHPKKPLVYISNINSGSVSVVDLALDSVINVIPCSKRVEGLDLGPLGSELWVTNIEQNTISVINTETYETIAILPAGKQPLRLKFSLDGKHVLLANAIDGNVAVYDTNSREQILTVTIPGKQNLLDKLIYGTPRPVGILMHPNGKYAFISNHSAGRVEVLDMSSFKLVSSIEVGVMPDGLALLN